MQTPISLTHTGKITVNSKMIFWTRGDIESQKSDRLWRVWSISLRFTVSTSVMANGRTSQKKSEFRERERE